MTFNPNDHIRKLSGKDYLEVKWRLVWLRTDHPDAVILTELVEHRPTDGMAVFKAQVLIPEGGSATGWGSETVKDFRDYLEKAETKAIGRALGALGYGTQFTTDFDEGDRIVDSPVERPQPAPKATRSQTQRPHGPDIPAHVQRVRDLLGDFLAVAGKSRTEELCKGLMSEYPHSAVDGRFSASQLTPRDAAEIEEIILTANLIASPAIPGDEAP